MADGSSKRVILRITKASWNLKIWTLLEKIDQNKIEIEIKLKFNTLNYNN